MTEGVPAAEAIVVAMAVEAVMAVTVVEMVAEDAAAIAIVAGAEIVPLRYA